MPLTIRPIAPQDRAAWDDLYAGYAAFYNTPLAPQTLDTVWSWIHDPANPFWCDLALDDAGHPLGFVQYQWMHRSLGGSMVCYLSDLFTLPAARGRGTGRALIDQVRAEIGPIAAPDVIQWAPGLPKTRSGKIMRRILRKIAENDFGALGDTSTLADPSVVDELIDNRMNRG